MSKNKKNVDKVAGKKTLKTRAWISTWIKYRKGTLHVSQVINDHNTHKHKPILNHRIALTMNMSLLLINCMHI